jgi:hypothetical protein
MFAELTTGDPGLASSVDLLRLRLQKISSSMTWSEKFAMRLASNFDNYL